MLKRPRRFVYAPELAQRGSQPAVNQRVIGIGAQYTPRSLDRALVIAQEIQADHELVQQDAGPGVAGVEPDAVFEGDKSLFGPAGKDQHAAQRAVGNRQVRIERDRLLDRRKGAVIIALGALYAP